MQKKAFCGVVAACIILVDCDEPGFRFPDQEEVCYFDGEREQHRQESAGWLAAPQIDSMEVDGVEVWRRGEVRDSDPRPVLRPGDIVTLRGSDLGYGVDVDFSKIMIGNSRVLETTLVMYDQELDIGRQVNYEVAKIQDTWTTGILSWQPDEIVFRVPVHASRGPLRVQIQKRIGYNESLLRPGEAHDVIDAQTMRIVDPDFAHQCDVVSQLGPPVSTDPIAVDVDNPAFADMVARGETLFWSYDYNIGLAHSVRNLNWTDIFDYKAKDPVTGQIADPNLLFGAYRAVRGQVPDVALDPVYFDPYPQPNPIPGFLTIENQLRKGMTSGSGWVGYRYAESSHPFKGKGAWIGFNCSSCHGYQITYEAAPEQTVTKVFPGLPNPTWSLKWALLGDFEGVKASEEGPAWEPGAEDVDKTHLIYSLPPGTGEHALVRLNGEGSLTDNDYQWSPIAIPNVTNHMPIRRSLSHTESYVGFEGSYIHSQEPDGATGAMLAEPLQAFTAYMTMLDRDDDLLRNLGIYRWLNSQGRVADVDDLSEGEFLQAGGWQNFTAIQEAVGRGAVSFADSCGECHSDTLGVNSTETMIRLDDVGRFFAPTNYHRERQAIRASFLRNLYWVQHRGLLSDGHVRNLEDLVDPDRCVEGTDLYNRYYTLHPPSDPGSPGADHPQPFPAYFRRGDVFRVPRAQGESRSAKALNRFVLRHKYFVEVPWDDEYYYWDYQKMRSEYGPNELGTEAPIGMPPAPHPWCAETSEEVADLTLFLLTL